MIVALLAMVAGICLTGWLYTTDAYWGVEWVGKLHEA
jgi:cytochrome b